MCHKNAEGSSAKDGNSVSVASKSVVVKKQNLSSLFWKCNVKFVKEDVCIGDVGYLELCELLTQGEHA